MKYNACGHFLIVELDHVPREEVSAGGIVLATTKAAQKGMCLAVVSDIGTNCWTGFTDPSGEWSGWCETGDKIMIAQYAGQSFPIPDGATQEEKERLSRMRLIRDEDVLARLSDE